MSKFICPVCKGKLERNEKAYICNNRHSFDISKDGYVNLLMSQQSSLKRHGDDKLMVRSRRDFLSAGYYEQLCDKICGVVKAYAKPSATIVDIGCGEGYYSQAICSVSGFEFYGIDISKDALKYASKSIKNGEFAVASAFNLPFESQSVDCLLNIFAPSAYEEFYRILNDDGYLIKAVPLEDHLWELKCAVYEVPYKNKPEIRNEDLFELVHSEELKYQINLNNSEDISNLFRMTPYYYKTSKEATEKILNKTELSTTVHFGVEVYRKRKHYEV